MGNNFATAGEVWMFQRNWYQFLEFVNFKRFLWQQITEPIRAGNYPQKQRSSFSEISFTANCISSHKNVQTLHVYPTFFLRFSLLFRQFPNSQTDGQHSHYSDGSNLNSGCNVSISLQHNTPSITLSTFFILALISLNILWICNSCNKSKSFPFLRMDLKQ